MEAISEADLPCEAFIAGVAVEVGERTAYVPDVVVNCGERVDRDAISVPTPVIVVEVTSPPTSRIDTIRKLADYFRVPSVQHYLIVDLASEMMVHYQRSEDGALATRITAAGEVRFDPPGITIEVAGLFQ